MPGQDFSATPSNISLPTATVGRSPASNDLVEPKSQLDVASYLIVRLAAADLITVPEAPVNTTGKVP
jgi:hypothetical protein